MQVKIKIDPASKILLKRSLQKGGKVQKFFTHEVRRRCDKYVPFRDGPLKKTLQLSRRIGSSTTRPMRPSSTTTTAATARTACPRVVYEENSGTRG